MEAVGARLAIPDKPVASMSLNTGIIGEDVPFIFPKELEAIEELLILCNSSAIGIQDATKANLALLVAAAQAIDLSTLPAGLVQLRRFGPWVSMGH
jgi:hypothetical protein